MSESLAELSSEISRLIAQDNYNESIPYMEKAAVLGDEQSQTILANLYTFGYYVDKDDEKAFHYTLLSAQSGNTDMMVNLAVFYKNGIGTEKDPEAAMGWFKKAAMENHPAAWYGLALAYYYGEGCYQDFQLSREFASKCAAVPGEYQEKAAMLLKDLAYEEAVEMYTSRSQSVGLEMLEDLARQGHLQSIVLLSAELSREGIPGHTQKEAFDWAGKAAAMEEPAGMYNLAIYCWYGIGTEQDHHEGFIWMKNAAKAGYQEAYLPLAQMYLLGEGVKPNMELALQWAAKALQVHPDDPSCKDTYNLVFQLYAK